ncbi:MAG: hypothetical protein ACT4OI_01985 [Methanobacteriota archaeon]
MRRRNADHEHRSLRFRVQGERGDVPFRPGIVVRRGSVLFLLEAVDAPDADAKAEVLAKFLQQHSPEIVLLVVAPEPVVERFPPEAYDEVYAEADLPRAVRRILEQDPRGFVRPFEKRRRA